MSNKVAKPEKKTFQNPQKTAPRTEQTKAQGNGNKADGKERGTFPTRIAFAT